MQCKSTKNIQIGKIFYLANPYPVKYHFDTESMTLWKNEKALREELGFVSISVSLS